MFWPLYFFVVALMTLFIRSRRRRVRIPYPPGPPSEPLLGHLRVIPSSNQEVVFRKWSKIYGEVIYLHIPGRSYLIVNSLGAATELLDKRSGIYSDRVRLPLYELMGWIGTLTFLPYGKHFQKQRRLLHEYLHPKKCLTYHPLVSQVARQLLIRLLDNPANWSKYFQVFSTSIAVKIAYGYEIESENDPYVEITDAAMNALVACGPIGSTPVDFMPFLSYFPSWFPGTYYAFKARSLYSAVRKMHEYPFEAVQRQIKQGTAKASYLSHYLEQLHGVQYDMEHINDLKSTACAILTGGSETTYSALAYFMLAMVLYPECQKRATMELDHLIGRNRLPEPSDRGSLPYVEAVLQEVYRWYTVVPTGIPHCSSADDVYNGMFIPKGTVIIPNAFTFLRDETIYADPDSFNPTRYLPIPEGNAEPFPIGQFGFGRRICPGQHLADGSLWVAIAYMLSTLNIGRVLDENGNETVPKIELIMGATSHPKPFSCTVKPRDATAENLIRQTQIWDNT